MKKKQTLDSAAFVAALKRCFDYMVDAHAAEVKAHGEDIANSSFLKAVEFITFMACHASEFPFQAGANYAFQGAVMNMACLYFDLVDSGVVEIIMPEEIKPQETVLEFVR